MFTCVWKKDKSGVNERLFGSNAIWLLNFLIKIVEIEMLSNGKQRNENSKPKFKLIELSKSLYGMKHLYMFFMGFCLLKIQLIYNWIGENLAKKEMSIKCLNLFLDDTI